MYTKIYIEKEAKNTTELSDEITEFAESCAKFWNREGAQIYCENLIGNLGDKKTNELAKNTKFDSWMLEMILIDLRTKANKYPTNIKVGRTSSHTWLSLDEERILMLHTNKNYK